MMSLENSRILWPREAFSLLEVRNRSSITGKWDMRERILSIISAPINKNLRIIKAGSDILVSGPDCYISYKFYG